MKRRVIALSWSRKNKILVFILVRTPDYHLLQMVDQSVPGLLNYTSGSGSSCTWAPYRALAVHLFGLERLNQSPSQPILYKVKYSTKKGVVVLANHCLSFLTWWNISGTKSHLIMPPIHKFSMGEQHGVLSCNIFLPSPCSSFLKLCCAW